jgi:AcrR family transcriptional regulator
MPVTDARVRKGAETRRAILDEARAVLGEGRPEVSLDKLAARVGVTKQAILHHFPSKERVFVELGLEVVAEECEAAVVAVGRKRGRKALDAFVRGLVGHYLGDIERFRLLYLRGQLVSDPLRWFTPEERTERLYPVTGRMYAVAEAAVRAGDPLPDGVDARTLVVTAHIASLGFATMYGMTEAAGDPMKKGMGAYLDVLLSTWLEGLWPAGARGG